MLLGIVLATPGAVVLGLSLALGGATGYGQTLLALAFLGALAGALGSLLFVAGIAVYVLAPLRDRDRAVQTAASYGTILGSLFLAIVAANVIGGAYILALRGVAQQGASQVSVDELLVAALVQELAIMGILYLRVIRPGAITRQSMGLVMEPLPRYLGYGAVTALAVLVLQVVIQLVFNALGVPNAQQGIFASLHRATPLQFAGAVLVIALLTGFVEESFFRGYVFRLLYQAKGPWQAYLASALVFAVLHVPFPEKPELASFLGGWLALVVPVFAIGLLFAFVYRRTGSLIPAMVAHALNNGSVLVVVFVFGVPGQQ